MAQNRRTFTLQTPADLYRKLNFEALELHNNPPDNIELRAYAVMNAVITAWQMKDWVFAALEKAGNLDRLDKFAGRNIKGNKEFGIFLCQAYPFMNMCFQLATAAKHLDVRQDAGPEVITTIEFQVDQEVAFYELTGQHEIMVRTSQNCISGPDLVSSLNYIWSHALPQLGLLESENAE